MYAPKTNFNVDLNFICLADRVAQLQKLGQICRVRHNSENQMNHSGCCWCWFFSFLSNESLISGSNIFSRFFTDWAQNPAWHHKNRENLTICFVITPRECWKIIYTYSIRLTIMTHVDAYGIQFDHMNQKIRFYIMNISSWQTEILINLNKWPSISYVQMRNMC